MKHVKPTSKVRQPYIDRYAGYDSEPLDGVLNNKARVIHIDGGVYLESICSLVAGIDKDGWFYILGLNSVETQQHIKTFASIYANINDLIL